MNIKPSVHVPALSGSRSALRRAFTTVVAGCALVLGVASAHAGDTPANSFSITGSAAAGTMPVTGTGTFEARFDGDKLKLTVRPWDQLDMGKRKGHTNDAFGFKKESRLIIEINKADLKLPEGGKSVSGKASGKITMGPLAKKGLPPETISKTISNISYTVKEAGGKYVFENVSFVFDYTPFASNAEICFMGKAPCVAKDLKITATGSVSK
jgi:hypothetical protein